MKAKPAKNILLGEKINRLVKNNKFGSTLNTKFNRKSQAKYLFKIEKQKI